MFWFYAALCAFIVLLFYKVIMNTLAIIVLCALIIIFIMILKFRKLFNRKERK